MKQLLIYDRPIVLNRTQHRQLRIRASLPDFRFASTLNSVPLTAPEFADAARHYPIVFAGEPAAATMPVALLGLAQEQNLFVGPDGAWAGETYIPAFLRRYPFAVANAEADGGLSVCVDQSFVCDGDEGVRLFDEKGADTPVLSGAMRFLADYQQATERTQAFMQSLRDSCLLVAKTVQIERPGHKPRNLQGFCVVDEARLQKLSGRALQKLSQSGALGLLYVHLMSLSNVQRLYARMDARTAAPLH